MADLFHEAKNKLAKLTTARPGVAITLALSPQLGRLLEATQDVAGLGTLVATLTGAATLGINGIGWVRDERRKRLMKALLCDPELTIEEFRQLRALRAAPVDREEILREVRSHLTAIDEAVENEVADALINVLRYRAKRPAEKQFTDSALAFFRDARLEELDLTKAILSRALEASPDDPLSLFNNRTLSDQKQEPGVLVVVSDRAEVGGGSGKYVYPAKAVLVRRLFRRLKDADFARSTGMSVGNFVYDGSKSFAPETDEDSLVIGRDAAAALIPLIP